MNGTIIAVYLFLIMHNLYWIYDIYCSDEGELAKIYIIYDCEFLKCVRVFYRPAATGRYYNIVIMLYRLKKKQKNLTKL